MLNTHLNNSFTFLHNQYKNSFIENDAQVFLPHFPLSYSISDLEEADPLSASPADCCVL